MISGSGIREPEPFVVLQIGEHKATTQTAVREANDAGNSVRFAKDKYDPMWNETLEIPLVPGYDLRNLNLEVMVLPQKGTNAPGDEFIGVVHLPLGTYQAGEFTSTPETMRGGDEGGGLGSRKSTNLFNEKQRKRPERHHIQ